MNQIQNSRFRIRSRKSAIGNRQSKIAIDGRYIQDHFPGIGRYTYNLIDALARIAPEQSFVILSNPALINTRYNINALAQHRNVELCYVSTPTFSFTEQYSLQSAISNRQSAVFHSPYFIKPYALRVPSVVTIFDLIPLRYPREVPRARARIFFRLAVTLAARSSTRLIVSSICTRDDLGSLLKVPRAKISVIPLAADARFALQSTAEIARVHEKYQLLSRYILTVGINKLHKNLNTLIEAWRRADLGVALVIAGAWDTRYDAKPADVMFLHNIDDADLPALYAGASMFIMPSLYEGFGLPPLEAMACGAPVICSNASSLPEVVGDAAIQFDPRDVDALAKSITCVANDPGLRNELCAKSLARAKQFSWERTARETLQVYRDVVGEE